MGPDIPRPGFALATTETSTKDIPVLEISTAAAKCVQEHTAPILVLVLQTAETSVAQKPGNQY